MAASSEVYVDTSALIAFADRTDAHHTLFRRLFAEPPRLLTSILVVAEGHAWFLRCYGRVRGMQFLSLIDELAPLEVASAGAAERSAAARLLRRFSDQDLTFTDAVGLHYIRERKIKTCWSTDFHLRLTGASLAIDTH